MVLNVLASTSLRCFYLRGLDKPLKSCNKILNVFFSKHQFKFCEYSTESNNIDILDTVQMQKYLNFLVNKYSRESGQSTEEISKLINEKINAEEELKTLKSMSSEGDVEFEKLIEKEKKKYSESIQEIKHNIFHTLISSKDENDERNVELTVEHGIGGEESRLFSEELLKMYVNYANYKNWEYFREENNISISGKFVFGHLKYEAGIHRVQRVPETEKSGRTHTSTCSVVILPQPKPHEVNILSKDLIVEKIKSSGPGGQNVNKRETCVRVKHIPTGITVENQTERYQNTNLTKAINKLRTILFNREQEKISKERKSLRKEQVGEKDYSEKIRTYHFSSNRVTDHRINYTTHNLKGFLEGNKELDFLISKLREFYKKKELLLQVQDTLESDEYKKFEKHQIR